MRDKQITTIAALFALVVLLGIASVIARSVLPAPHWIISATIANDVTGEPLPANVIIDGQLYAQGVSEFRYPVTKREVRVRVEAEGFEPWDFTFTYKEDLPNAEVSGPIGLKPLVR